MAGWAGGLGRQPFAFTEVASFQLPVARKRPFAVPQQLTTEN
jgi:hypothetical protein